MSDSLKGVKANVTIRNLTPDDMLLRASAINEQYLKIREKAVRQMREYIEWVADCAYQSGLQREDLHLIANNAGIGNCYMLIINKRDLALLGEAHLNWVHDELQITTQSVYGSKPEEAE